MRIYASSMVVLGVELSCNQSSTTCPGDVVQCECQVTSSSLQWLARDLQSESVPIVTFNNQNLGMSTSSDPYTATLCSVDTSTSPNTLTSKLTATPANTVVVTCRDVDTTDTNTTRLTVAGELSTK